MDKMSVPDCLKHQYELGKYFLSGFPVAIAENHTRSHGRILADALLKSGRVKQFFIELGPDSDKECVQAFGTYMSPVNSAFEAMGQAIASGQPADEDEIDTIESAFAKLISTDAQPTLKELANTAWEREVEVIAADVKIRLGHMRIPERDEATGKCISHYAKNWGQGALLMWGANHFKKGGEGLQDQVTLHNNMNRPYLIDVSNMVGDL
jgi:hypothetical protein